MTGSQVRVLLAAPKPHIFEWQRQGAVHVERGLWVPAEIHRYASALPVNQMSAGVRAPFQKARLRRIPAPGAVGHTPWLTR